MTRLTFRWRRDSGKPAEHPYRNEPEPYAIEKRSLSFAITVPDSVADVLIMLAWLAARAFSFIIGLFGKRVPVEVEYRT